MKKGMCCLCCALLMLSLLLTGCGGKEADAERVTVRLNEVTHSVFYAPQYVPWSWASLPTRGWTST